MSKTVFDAPKPALAHEGESLFILPEDRIGEIQRIVHYLATQKGWHESRDPKDPNTHLAMLALIHSEVSEAVEEIRKGGEIVRFVDGKPEGVGSELADIAIRLFDYAAFCGINLEYRIVEKHAYNETRSRRHGGKLA